MYNNFVITLVGLIHYFKRDYVLFTHLLIKEFSKCFKCNFCGI